MVRNLRQLGCKQRTQDRRSENVRQHDAERLRASMPPIAAARAATAARPPSSSSRASQSAASETLKASTPLPSMLVRSVELMRLVLARIRAGDTRAGSCGDSEEFGLAEV